MSEKAVITQLRTGGFLCHDCTSTFKYESDKGPEILPGYCPDCGAEFDDNALMGIIDSRMIRAMGGS